MNKATISIFIVSQLLIAPVAFSAVYINLTDLGNGEVELAYDCSEEPYRIRAFALDITVSNGMIILVDNINPHYFIYPVPLSIDECGVLSLGSPIAGDVLGRQSITVEVGSLYDGEANAPPFTGVLLTFMISAECNVSVGENTLRGGITFEEPSHEATVVAPILYGVPPPVPSVYGGGSGTEDDPYLIFDADQLNQIGLTPGDWNKHFKLMADIDLTEYIQDEFNIIGNGLTKPFSGIFNGNGQRILNFSYTCQGANFASLFGCVNGPDAQVRNLCLSYPNVSLQAGSYAGSLVGCLRHGTVSSCCSGGGSVSGDMFIGGLIGWNKGGTIENCYSTTDVDGTCSVGGLAGKGYDTINTSYSAGDVASGANKSGGFAGYNEGNISRCFWDTQTSDQSNGIGEAGGGTADVTGHTTLMMKMESTFTSAGWDFKDESTNGTDDIWQIAEGASYPTLVDKSVAGNFAGPNRVDFRDFAVLAAAWKSVSGDDHWNQLCDIAPISTPDGTIDELDLAVFVSNYLAEEP